MSRHIVTPLAMERIELDDGTTLSETVRKVKQQLIQGLQSLLPSPLMLTPAMVTSGPRAAQMLLAPWCSYSWPAVKERALTGQLGQAANGFHWVTLYTQAAPTTLTQREDAALENLLRLAAVALGPQGNLQQLLKQYPTAEAIAALARKHSEGAVWFPSLAGVDDLTESRRKQLADAMPREGIPVAEEEDTLYRSSLHKLVRHFVGQHFLHIKQLFLGRRWSRCYPTAPLAIEQPRTQAWRDLLLSFVGEDPEPGTTPTAVVADAELIAVEKTTLMNMLVSRWIREDVCAALEDRLSSLIKLEQTALFRPLRAADIIIPDTALRLWESLQTECQRLLRQHTCEDSLASLRSLTQSLHRHVWQASLSGRERARAVLRDVCDLAASRCWDLCQDTIEPVVTQHNQTVFECKRTAVRTYRTAQSLVTDGIRLLVAGVKDLLRWSPLIWLQPLTPAQLAFRTQWHRPTTLRTCGCNADLPSYATCFLQEGTLTLARRLPEVYVQLVTRPQPPNVE
jgi:hypothetical protein